MSTNSMDNKFGLPKPDFQALPKKKYIWPVLITVAIVAMLIAGKLGYHFYRKVVDPPKAMLRVEPAHDGDATNQPKDTSSLSVARSRRAHVTKAGTTTNEGKNNKIKKSISATKKKLAAKPNKPLLKPGTYQELKGPQGIYHLVVVSHLDKPSAMKEVQALMRKNLGVYLILPRIDKGEKYYRVTIGHSTTQYEAEQKLKQFNATYSHIFVLKY